MASFLLGDDYASSSSSSDDQESHAAPTSTAAVSSYATSTATRHALPSADALFASDTRSVLTSTIIRSVSGAPAQATNKRKNEQLSRPAATKALKTERKRAVHTPQVALFAPPQLRRPNISTEDRSAWNTTQTVAWQKKVNIERPSS
ncbi:unnamed protein product [Hyaloperonospora brassicae]|uniref:RxLR effector candidate protein n=1 Tax=Hyaloperonospora brassicae TaxID=162125 RepID=A0AAV0TH62_HYABA|nr:unnamed protein product [Hyaloperonospora brassicae]